MNQIVENVLSRYVKESFNPDEDDFQHLISSSFSKDTSLVEFSRRSDQ